MNYPCRFCGNAISTGFLFIYESAARIPARERLALQVFLSAIYSSLLEILSGIYSELAPAT